MNPLLFTRAVASLTPLWLSLGIARRRAGAPPNAAVGGTRAESADGTHGETHRRLLLAARRPAEKSRRCWTLPEGGESLYRADGGAVPETRAARCIRRCWVA